MWGISVNISAINSRQACSPGGAAFRMYTECSYDWLPPSLNHPRMNSTTFIFLTSFGTKDTGIGYGNETSLNVDISSISKTSTPLTHFKESSHWAEITYMYNKVVWVTIHLSEGELGKCWQDRIPYCHPTYLQLSTDCRSDIA